MKRILLSAIAAAMFSLTCFGQGAMNEAARLAIAVEDPVGVTSDNAAATLKDNITKALVLNGLASTDSRFTIVPRVSTASMKATSTVPAKYLASLDVNLFLVDLYTGTIFSQTEFSVQGIGDNDKQAYLTAIRTIQSRHRNLKTLIINGKDKILAYFDANGDQILARVKAAADKGDYKSARIEAMAIPDACADLRAKADEMLAAAPAGTPTQSDVNSFYYSGTKEERVNVILSK